MAEDLEVIIELDSDKKTEEVIKHIRAEERDVQIGRIFSTMIDYALSEPDKDCSKKKRKKLERELNRNGGLLEIIIGQVGSDNDEQFFSVDKNETVNKYVVADITLLRIMPPAAGKTGEKSNPAAPVCAPQHSPVKPAWYSILKEKAKEALATTALLGLFGGGIYLCCREEAKAGTSSYAGLSQSYVAAPQIPLEPSETNEAPFKRPKRQYVERIIDYDSPPIEVRPRRAAKANKPRPLRYNLSEEETITPSLDRHVIPASKLRQ